MAVGEAEPLILKAPAKINLLLKVHERQPDGYHQLTTWMQKLDLYDTITLRLTGEPGIRLSCNTPAVPVDDTNLAWRAAACFLEKSRRLVARGVAIELTKAIPVGAGLGGGSSDAGTVLRGLNQLAEAEFDSAVLMAMGQSLGADVPFFTVADSAVLARGIGERLQQVAPLTDCTFILLNPGFAVSTRWVYETLALTRQNEVSILAGFRKHDAASLSLDCLENDLELVTSGEFPEIERMKQVLLDAGASRAMMSGSGPTVFGVFPDKQSDQVDISGIVAKLRREYQDRVYVARACAGAWPSG